jgi:hypothetical protein
LSPSLIITCHSVDQIELAESGLEIWFPLVMLYVRVCRFGPLTRTSTSVGVMMSEPMPIDPAPAAPLMMFAIPGFGRMMAAGTETTTKVSRSSTSTKEAGVFAFALAEAKDYAVIPHSVKAFQGIYEGAVTGQTFSDRSLEVEVLRRLKAGD